MKHFAKRITAFAVAALLIISVAAIQAGAAIEYRLNGFIFDLINNTTATITGYENQTPDMVIPDKLLEIKVVSIANDAFKGNTEIASVDFSQALYLDKIGVSAFAGCSGISGELVLPESITSIMYSAFQECTSISSAVINANIKNIPQWCFYRCYSLETVLLPDGLETIERAAFAGCTSLSYVNIPANVTEISEYSFSDCPDLTLGVWFGSYGHEYAQSHNIPYILLDSVLLGDANGDGYVNISDVTDIQRAVAEMDTLDDLRQKAADINGDGVVTIDDATFLQTYLAEFGTAYPIGEVA